MRSNSKGFQPGCRTDCRWTDRRGHGVHRTRTGVHSRKNFSHPLAKGRKRALRVKLLGGFVMWISSLYCEPRRGLFRQADDEATGVYIEISGSTLAKRCVMFGLRGN